MTKQELEICINEYGRDIYSFCRHLTPNQQEADDLYQDTFLTAVKLSSKIDYENNPKSYLLSIALRIWKNKRRKFAWRKRITDIQLMVEERDVDRSAPTELSPEEKIIREEKNEAVRTAVNKLPEKFKIVVLLFYMENLSAAQISKIIQIPVGTVLSRLHHARKILRKELEDILDEHTIR